MVSTRTTDVITGNVIAGNNKTMMITMGIALLFVLGVIVWVRGGRTPEAMGSLSNIGGASRMDNIVNPLRKPLQCYGDLDCPDGTSCNKDGLCIPKLVNLPTSQDAQDMGLGREKEKTT
jgi:hypothetical protein